MPQIEWGNPEELAPKDWYVPVQSDLEEQHCNQNGNYRQIPLHLMIAQFCKYK
jgi:hypothetical protein